MTSTQIILTLIGASGFWTVIQTVVLEIIKAKTNQNPERRALVGLLHQELVEECEHFIAQGHIKREEYEDLNKYIYQPYKELGGNGTAERLMKEIDKLSIT